MTSLKRGVVARGVCPEKTIYMVREDGVGPLYPPIQGHFDLHSRPSDAQIVFRYEDTLKAAYRLYSDYDPNLGRLSVPPERLPRLEALDEELFNMVATEPGLTEVIRLQRGADCKEEPLWTWHVAHGLRQRHLKSLVVPDGELTLPAGWTQIVREGHDWVHRNLGWFNDPNLVCGPREADRTTALTDRQWLQSRLSSVFRNGLANDPAQLLAHAAVSITFICPYSPYDPYMTLLSVSGDPW